MVVRPFRSARRVLSLAAIAVALPASPVAAQDRPAPTGEMAVYEADPAHPFGRRHPDAPTELDQFAFMIGAFHCTDRILGSDGTWVEFPAIWNASWVLDGHAIEDRYWSPRFATRNMRIFDPDRGEWTVTFFRMPGYASGTWSGGREEDEMVLRREISAPDGTSWTSRLTFHSFGPDGFEWRSERVDPDGVRANWTSSCRRAR